jgi:hypothetical protein
LTTYRDVLVHELAGARLIGRLHGSPGAGLLDGHSVYTPNWKAGYDLFEFERPNGEHVFLAFADTDRPVTVKVPASAGQATLVDRHNVRTMLRSQAGFYVLQLAGATNEAGWPTMSPANRSLGSPEHLVGGATEMIIESPTR